MRADVSRQTSNVDGLFHLYQEERHTGGLCYELESVFARAWRVLCLARLDNEYV